MNRPSKKKWKKIYSLQSSICPGLRGFDSLEVKKNEKKLLTSIGTYKNVVAPRQDVGDGGTMLTTTKTDPRIGTDNLTTPRHITGN